MKLALRLLALRLGNTTVRLTVRAVPPVGVKLVRRLTRTSARLTLCTRARTGARLPGAPRWP